MLLTWKQNLKHLTFEEYHYLRRLCRLSKDVYNQSLYNIRQHYFSEKEYLRYEANWGIMKHEDTYKLLGGGIAQQSMRAADQSFKSFFGLLKLAKKGQYENWRVKLPNYLDKEGFFELTFTDCNRLIHEGKFQVPVSRVMRKESKTLIHLNVPDKLRDKNIHQIRIIPKYNASFFEVRYIFEDTAPGKPSDLDFSKGLGIDLGVSNFATCATNDGDSFIIDGRKIKSINQGYCKEIARLQSIKDKQKIKSFTKLQYIKSTNRRNQLDDIVYKSAKYIINYCLDHHIGNIVVGYNDGFQDNPNLRYKKTTQLFCSMPYGKLKSRLEYLSNLYGIHYQVQEESYTSKASFFDDDVIPVWNPRNPKQTEFSGRRTHRGLYKTSKNYKFNADVNGALNILRKSNAVDTSVLCSRGEVVTPLRIRVV